MITQTCIQTNSLWFLTLLLITLSLTVGYRWGFSRCLTKKLNATYLNNLHAFRQNMRK